MVKKFDRPKLKTENKLYFFLSIIEGV